jgi:hydrogenase-4 component H
MNILNLLSQNFGGGSRTRTPEDSVPYPNGYRGQITHTVELCTGCGTCVYVCSPGAISIRDDEGGQSVTWKYTEDQCTFCSFCVEHCPTQALGIKAESPAILSDRSQHYLIHSIALPLCKECGQPAKLMPEMALIHLYGDPLPEEIESARGLCENCRQRVTGQRFVTALAGKEK